MKIFCIGKNYKAHAEELGSTVPKEPLVFMKPPTSLLEESYDFHYPSFCTNVHYEVELVLKLGKGGKNISKNEALGFIDGIALGIDFTCRDLQFKLKEKGHPWEIAKGFDDSALVSKFTSFFPNKDYTFSLSKNGKVVQQGNSNMMVYDFSTIISYISNIFTLEKGDIIYTGTPEGVGPVQKGDQLEGFLTGESIFKSIVK